MKYLLLSASMLTLLACDSKKDESNQTSTEVTSADILAFKEYRAKADAVASADFTDELLSTGSMFMSWFYDEGSSAGDEGNDAASEDCLSKGLSYTIAASGKVLTAKAVYTPDPTCLAAEKAAAKADGTSQGLGVFTDVKAFDLQFTYVCKQDVSALDGRTDLNIDFESTCGGPIGMGQVYKTESDLYYYSTLTGSLQETQGHMTQHTFKLGADGGACSYTEVGDDLVESPGCAEGTYTSISGLELFSRTNYVYQMHNGLIATPGPQAWYKNGTVDFELNNWGGTLTYSDGNKAPTWTASDGTTRLSGNLDEAMGLQRFLPKNLYKPSAFLIKDSR